MLTTGFTSLARTRFRPLCRCFGNRRNNGSGVSSHNLRLGNTLDLRLFSLCCPVQLLGCGSDSGGGNRIDFRLFCRNDGVGGNFSCSRHIRLRRRLALGGRCLLQIGFDLVAHLPQRVHRLANGVGRIEFLSVTQRLSHVVEIGLFERFIELLAEIIRHAAHLRHHLAEGS